MTAATIRELVARAAHYLPAQGPITAFVHHNTLHAFEHLPFEDGVEQAAELYGCEPYASEARYRSELEHGGIRAGDLREVLADELGTHGDEVISGLVSRFDLHWTMLTNAMRTGTEPEVAWVIAAGDGVRSFRERCPTLHREQLVADTRRWLMRDLRTQRPGTDHLRAMSKDLLARSGETRMEFWRRAIWEEFTLTLLWRLCRAGVHGIPCPRERPSPARRLPHALRLEFGQDPDELVHETLIHFCSAFADQGMAAWQLPQRAAGFFASFLALYRAGNATRWPWLRGLTKLIAQLERSGVTPEASIESSLVALGVADDEREPFILQSLLALRGWAGMLWQLENRPDRVAHGAPPGTLLEFLAVRLLLDRLACDYVRKLPKRRGIAHDADRYVLDEPGDELDATSASRGYMLFLLAQSLGWSPRRLAALQQRDWEALLAEVDAFTPFARRRLLHRAYEQRYRTPLLAALARPPQQLESATDRVEAQVVCCIDEREESFRRHIEELDHDIETFGAVGFFGLAMYYRGADDAHGMPLCPVAIRPEHRIREVVVDEDRARFERMTSWRRRLGLAAHGLRTGSHAFFRGLPIALFGAIAAIPLVSRVFFPRLLWRIVSRVQTYAKHFARPPIRTRLVVDRDASPADEHGATDTVRDGYTVDEMAAVVESLLRDMGLAWNFARIVLVVGHGSSSLNNPHEAAHDCGACGGGRGGPNARAFALIANDPAVREQLHAAGLSVPDDTVFVGAYHNTCDESMTYYDEHLLPASHRGEYAALLRTLDAACRRNAHERCRRFRSASLFVGDAAARRHVEARALDLAQPRPEFGHATNAACFVGRRSRTRALFLDRRAFLVSYDPRSDADDDDAAILSQLLAAVVPVCAGINLEYYFSYVDPTGWGCGTKLPHNVTSLLGVMDGFASDLRPGLPWQMVEIHDPVRLTLIVETTPDRLRRILERCESVSRLCANRWIHLATLDPDSSDIHVLEGGEFRLYACVADELPEAVSSAQWYGGLREHLEPSVIRGEPVEAALR